MPARRDIDKASAATVAAGLARAGRTGRGSSRDGPIEVELHPALGAGGDLVALQDDDTAADLRRPV